MVWRQPTAVTWAIGYIHNSCRGRVLWFSVLCTWTVPPVHTHTHTRMHTYMYTCRHARAHSHTHMHRCGILYLFSVNRGICTSGMVVKARLRQQVYNESCFSNAYTQHLVIFCTLLQRCLNTLAKMAMFWFSTHRKKYLHFILHLDRRWKYF